MLNDKDMDVAALLRGKESLISGNLIMDFPIRNAPMFLSIVSGLILAWNPGSGVDQTGLIFQSTTNMSLNISSHVLQ